MHQRTLGKSGPKIGAVALGCMSFAGAYGNANEGEPDTVLHTAHELGITHLDTAKIYGDGLSETIVGAFLKANPSKKFTIATKGGIMTAPKRGFDNSPEYMRECLEGSLKRLGVEYVDLYYIHRRDKTIPIEDVAGTMARFVQEGKIGGIGFSEISPASLRRAHAVHPVMAVQNEYSLWTRQPELGLLQTCEELGAAFVAFSPVGRGVLTDNIPDPQAFPATDFRKMNPRFIEPDYSLNLPWLKRFQALARDMGHATSTLAIAWSLGKGEHILPSPGTRSAAHTRELAKAGTIKLTTEDIARIEKVLPVGFANGPRYAPQNYADVEIYG